MSYTPSDFRRSLDSIEDRLTKQGEKTKTVKLLEDSIKVTKREQKNGAIADSTRGALKQHERELRGRLRKAKRK